MGLLDFTELRERILSGEEEESDEEQEETPLTHFQIESRESLTILPFCVSAATFGVIGYDKVKNDGAIFGGYTPIVLMVGGFLPLGYSIGRLSRGLVAQKTNDKYEKLLDTAQDELEQTETEKQEAESRAHEAEQNDYRFDYLNAEMSSTHEPSIFGGSISAFGQEAVSFRPSHKPHDRLWG